MSGWLDGLLYTWVLPYIMYWLAAAGSLVWVWQVWRRGVSVRQLPPWWKPR
jgi:hypothetical protein